MFLSTNEEPYFRHEIIVVEEESLFKYVKMESFIKTSPNGKSGGIDGVSYEDLKDSRDEYCHVLVNIINVMLINHRLSCHWKEAITQRIPKKNFNIEDQSTIRDILLLPVCYEVLSKAICNRIIPIISNKIDFLNRTYLNKTDRQELIFLLKTAIDDFRDKSKNICISFHRFYRRFL